MIRFTCYVTLFALVLGLIACQSEQPREPYTFDDISKINADNLASGNIADLTGNRESPLSIWIGQSITNPEALNKNPLLLNGVTDLSVEEIAVLRQWKGNRIFLPDLQSLGLAQVTELLARPRYWNEIYLDGVKTLEPEVAQAFAEESPSRLSLRGLKDPSPQVLAILAKTKNSLDLSGMTEISLEQARELSAFKSFNEMVGLSLDGLKTIDDEAAKEIGKIKSWLLSLSGLERLPLNTIQALSFSVRPCLRLNGVKNIDLAAAQAIAKYWKVKFLYLTGITSLPDDVKAILEAKITVIVLGN